MNPADGPAPGPGSPRLDASTPVVGIVPAAGRARRLGAPSRSKELTRVYLPPGGRRPLPVCYRLLHAFAEAAIPEALVVTRSAKSDLRAVLGAGDPTTPRLRHVVLDDSPSPAFSIAAATRRARDAVVALGFPDVLWKGPEAFRHLLEELHSADGDVVLGLFPPAPDYPTHEVELDGTNRVLSLRAPGSTADPDFAWTLAVWKASFSRHLEAAAEARGAGGSGELGMTEVLREALVEGFRIRGVPVSDRPFLDVGDPDRLAEARRRAELLRP